MKAASSQNAPSSGSRAGAFTLIELLIVITVIAILIAVAAPTILGSVGASRLTSGGETLVGLFSEAQSRANSNNRPVEVRLYRVPSEEDALNGASAEGFYRGVVFTEYYQTGELDPRAATQKAYTQLMRPLAVVRKAMHLLPGGTAISEDVQMSTLIGNRPDSLDGDGQTVDAVLRVGDKYIPFTPPASKYRSFVFYPEGTDLDEAAKWYLTVTSTENAEKAPTEVRNFYTIQVDALTGRLSSYRPSIQ
ncbi:Verru_Chthon cassette protein D [Roseimicrobium gellanilyticum]|nr:Verru_Chthon cassette protein D [Roseimicrobium gellanilyticum]